MVQASPQTWDEVARHYTHEIAPAERHLAEEIAGLLDGVGLRPPARLIEVGAGSGHLSLVLREQGYDTTLLDFSPVALEHARAIYAEHGYGGEADDKRFILGDAFALHEMGLGGFDLAWSSGVCEHFDAERLERMLRGMAGVARHVLVIVPNPESLFYLAGRRRQTERCTWNVGVELLRRNYEDVFHAAGLGQVRRGFIGRDWTHAWIRLAVGEEAAPVFEQLMAEGLVPPRESYLQYFLAGAGADAMHADNDMRRSSYPHMDAEAFDRTYYMDALGTTMVALSKMREEVDRLKAEAFAAETARAAAQTEAATLARALEQARQTSDETGKLARCEQSLRATEEQLARCEQSLHATEEKLALCEQSLHAAEEKLALCEQSLRATEEKLALRELSLHATEEKLALATRHIESLSDLGDSMMQRARAAEAERDMLLASTSWRITGPLRKAVIMVRRFGQRAGAQGAQEPGSR